jgi:hypothetical protein
LVFDVRDGKQGGHKIFVHQGLSSFQSGSFNCGHGKNPEINPLTSAKLLKFLSNTKKSLRRITVRGNYMIDASKYTITVRKGLFDGEECFEARIAELPDCRRICG